MAEIKTALTSSGVSMTARPVPRGKQPVSQQYQFGPWTLTSTKSHILESEGHEREKFESELELPQLPEMVFADNTLSLQHQGGFGLVFTALGALKLVDAHQDPLKVAAAAEWQNARSSCEHIQNVVKLITGPTGQAKPGLPWTTSLGSRSHPSERIDLEKLKLREKIMFYDDVLLFEDELSDNGSSILSVKIRVMPSSFFILLRFFMRVDNVMIRINDTRIYHQGGQNYILEVSSQSKDDKVENLKVSSHLFTDPNEINKHLPLRAETFEKLEFPEEVTTCEPDSTVDTT
ncbi:LOW QUALITY PROTEIN: TIP41-like protein [Haliotis rubra]|uniref:LOW QUALITY PROTEIN: TIP41-like protein n=1 Tax=Haliotis rubra TaxID=36100 RepID=UPI001EE59990|nr:LOW QUALITY PROTEIN: TIP41-like protein [Haliotis rubra]